MHIIALAGHLSSSNGGLERSLFDVCQGLAQRGHDISLLYEKEGDQLAKYQQFCQQITKINSYALERQQLLGSMSNFLGDIGKVSGSQNSIVYSSQYFNFFFGYALSLLKAAKFVCHLRLPAPIEENKLKAIKQSVTLRRVKKYIAVSNQVKADWSGRLGIKPDSIDVVYNAIETETFRPTDKFVELRKAWNIPVNTKLISYVGRLDKHKGVETLIKAFAAITHKYCESKLLIAGKSLLHGEEYELYLKHLASELNLGDRVQFLGHLSNPIPLYQISDVTALPSLWAEPFGRTIIEAMSCGTPVVASRTGGIPEILVNQFSVGLFEPGNEIALAQSLDTILNWRDTNPNLGQQCREHVLYNFSLNTMLDGVESVMLSALSDR